MTSSTGIHGIAAIDYDGRNQAVRVVPESGSSTNYRYSADGQRYWKKPSNGSGTFYAMDGAVNVGVFHQYWEGGYFTIVGPAGEVIGREEYDGMWLLRGRRYYVKDHLGTTRVVLDESATVLETRDHYPFIPLRSTSRPTASCGLEMPGRSFVSGQKTKENFTGHELDDEPDLIYNGVRAPKTSWPIPTYTSLPPLQRCLARVG